MKFKLVSLIIIVLAITSYLLYKNSNKSNSPRLPIPISQTTKMNVSKGEVPAIPFSIPQDFTIHIFAKDLENPRDITFSPGGTLLVSIPTSNQVVALADKDHDGVSDSTKILIANATHPHGLAFYNGKLFVAEVNKVTRYNWDEEKLQARFDKILFTLPNNNNHNNRTIVFDSHGTMYVSVGSTCNVCRETSDMSATIIASNENGDNPHVFAKGLRNAPFMAFKSTTDELWATEMGRDFLGDNLPPDEINIIQNGGDYGWPYCYGNKVHDTNFDAANKHSCTNTVPPFFEIPAHSAPLGLTFINSSQFPSDWQNDLLVAYHGSWNRSVPTGYKIVHMKVSGNTITSAEDFITGFAKNGTTFGRPVDVLFDSQGNLFISDDKAGMIYIVQKK